MREKVLQTKRTKPVVEKKAKSQIREYTEAILVALLAALVLRTFVIQAFRIPTGSMKDTLLVGDFLLVNKFVYGVRLPDSIPFLEISLPFAGRHLPAFKAPQPGDIIVFKYPADPKLDYIKRCIAVAGQTVEMKAGVVYVDGQPEGKQEFVKREYDSEEMHYVLYYRITTPRGKVYTIRHYEDHNLNDSNENFGPIRIRDGHYFMMGDNRDNSADSRSWGLLPAGNIVGEAMVIYWSWDKQVPLYQIFNKVRWLRIGDLIK
ncbi:MAG: signal peptidase I [candidate division KSB1 bacterium]|nr:signal peptidase I [candidate division KSB1 bacterium]MDZ7303995.1 signal peptidase I [candidate division KSB1 bacterium]MDZ7313295.1 signal peptidase I [candidate division KSB1 bacterium]